VHAVREQRATYIGYDLRSLHQDADVLAVGPQPAWRVEARDMSVTVSTRRDGPASDDLSIVRAVANAVWANNGDAESVTIEAGDDTAHDALQRWSLV
jgi:glycerol-1-phosphatase